MEEKNDKKEEIKNLKNKKVKQNLTQNEFYRFIKPFFADVDENLIDFLERPKIDLFSSQKNDFETHLLVSSLKPNKKKSEKFLNQIKIQDKQNIKLKKRSFVTNEEALFNEIPKLPIDEEEKKLIQNSLNDQFKINIQNKNELLKVLDRKIPVLAHKKMEITYDAQILSRYKSYYSSVQRELKKEIKPMILKGLVIEKLEYLNLFETEDNALELLNDNSVVLKENSNYQDENIKDIFN